MTWTDKESLEAYFGAWRVRCFGTDIRGFWKEEDARTFAAKLSHRDSSVGYSGRAAENGVVPL